MAENKITAIGTAMIEVMREWDITWVMWGDPHALHEAFTRSGSTFKPRHPLRVWDYVLNALDRDSRFEKRFNRVHVGAHNQERLVRAFKWTGSTPGGAS